MNKTELQQHDWGAQLGQLALSQEIGFHGTYVLSMVKMTESASSDEKTIIVVLFTKMLPTCSILPA